jgi:putative ATP-dependent endonuclease of OLD family
MSPSVAVLVSERKPGGANYFVANRPPSQPTRGSSRFTGRTQKNCVDNYAEHAMPHAKVFADTDSNQRTTFEICLYEDNKTACDEVFRKTKRRLEPLAYMLANKADAAFDLLLAKEAELVAPGYVQEAIKWINE